MAPRGGSKKKGAVARKPEPKVEPEAAESVEKENADPAQQQQAEIDISTLKAGELKTRLAALGVDLGTVAYEKHELVDLIRRHAPVEERDGKCFLQEMEIEAPKEDLSQLRVKELISRLTALGVTLGAVAYEKQELVQMLERYQAAGKTPTKEASVFIETPEKLTREELRQKLREKTSRKPAQTVDETGALKSKLERFRERKEAWNEGPGGGGGGCGGGMDHCAGGSATD